MPFRKEEGELRERERKKKSHLKLQHMYAQNIQKKLYAHTYLHAYRCELIEMKKMYRFSSFSDKKHRKRWKKEAHKKLFGRECEIVFFICMIECKYLFLLCYIDVYRNMHDIKAKRMADDQYVES